MKLELFVSLFVTFVTTSESIWCYKCHSGNFTYNLYSDFPKTDCSIPDNNSSVAQNICKFGCVKLQIEDNVHELNVYDCDDKYIDKKLNAKAAIKNKTVCYKNFCNGERDWNILKSKNSDTKKSVSEFWIYIVAIALLGFIIHIIRLICGCKVFKHSERNETSVNSRTRLISGPV